MRKMHEKEIDGVQYSMYEMNPFKSAPLLTRILKLLGNPLAKMIQGAKQKEGGSFLDADISGDLMGEAIKELTERLNEKDVNKLMQDLLVKDLITFQTEDMDAPKKIVNIENHFGKFGLLHLFKVVRFSLEVNFGDFFGGLAELKE